MNRFAIFSLMMLAFVSQSRAQLQPEQPVKLRISTSDLANTYINIRQFPGGPIVTAVQEQDFEVLSANDKQVGGLSYHLIKLSRTGKTGYVAQLENVNLIYGVLRVNANGPVNIRTAGTLNSEVIARVFTNAEFDVLQRFERGGHVWSKVLLRDADKIKSGYISETESASAQPNFLPVANKEVEDAQVAVPFCSSGNAILGALRSHQVIYRTPAYNYDTFEMNGMPKAVTLPRGTRVKVLTQNGVIVVSDGFMPIQFNIPVKSGFLARKAYVRRSEVKIDKTCRPYGADIVASRGLQKWGASEYRSLSALQRSTNLSMALSRIDGDVAPRNVEYSFLEGAVFGEELSALNKSTSDLDQMGCPSGYMFNPSQTSRLQGFCRPFIMGTSTTLQPVYAGGICGASTLTHRAVFATGLPITRYHNHGFYYPGSYGLSDDVFGIAAGQGTEAEVAWDTLSRGGRDWAGYRFFNDTSSDLYMVTTSWYDMTTNVTHTTLQFYGNGPSDRRVYLNSVKPADDTGNRYKWTRGIQYVLYPQVQKNANIPGIQTSFENGWRYDTIKTHYHCVKALNSAGKEIIDPATGKNKILCSGANYNF